MKHDPFARAVSESIGEDTVADTKGSECCFQMHGFYVVGWLGYYCITCNNLRNKHRDHNEGKSQVRHTCCSCWKWSLQSKTVCHSHQFIPEKKVHKVNSLVRVRGWYPAMVQAGKEARWYAYLVSPGHWTLKIHPKSKQQVAGKMAEIQVTMTRSQ